MAHIGSLLRSVLILTVGLGLGGCGTPAEPENTALTGADEESVSADALSGNRPVGSTLQTTANLNLRTGPSTSQQILLTMPRGSNVSVVASQPSGAWYQIKYGSRTGWAHGNYLIAPNATDVKGGGGGGGGGTSPTKRVGGGPVVAHAQRFVNDACNRYSCPYELGTREGHDPSRTRAVDMMMARYGSVAGGTERTRGDQIAAFAVDNERDYKLYYVIWRQRINSADGRGWRGMANRGSNTENHQDHVHVSFDP